LTSHAYVGIVRTRKSVNIFYTLKFLLTSFAGNPLDIRILLVGEFIILITLLRPLPVFK